MAAVVDAATAQWLTDAYRDYRAVLHRLSLDGPNERVVEAAPHAAQRARIQRIWSATLARRPRAQPAGRWSASAEVNP